MYQKDIFPKLAVSIFLFFVLLQTKLFGQILTPTYPTAAKDIYKGTKGSELTVQVGFASSCTDDTLTVIMPFGVHYVKNSILKISGNLTITELDVSNKRKPKFKISNVSGTGVITFSLIRRASCSAPSSGKDTIEVSGSCGKITENSSINVYNIYSPSLAVTAPSSIINSFIGKQYTRDIDITNGGLGYTDTVFLSIVYKNSGLINYNSNQIEIGGNYFSPVKLTGDTFFYKLYGSTLFGGDSLFSNGESILIHEFIQVAKCNPITNYIVSWSPKFNNCTSVKVSSSISMLSGVPALNSIISTNVNYVDRCTPYDVNFTAKNSGTGNDTAATMFNVKIYHAYVYPGQTLQPYNASILSLTNGRINGIAVSTFSNSGAIATMDLDNLFNYDPDGAGIGLEDIDGDSFYDDLPKGNSVVYTLNFQWLCNTSCGKDKIYYSGGYIQYSNMCGITKQTAHVYSNRPVYEAQFTGTAYLPANIIGGVPFTINLKEGHYINSYINSGINTRYRWILKLPAGVSLFNGGNMQYGGSSSAATVVQSGDTVYITSNSNDLQNATLDLVFTCGSGGSFSFSYGLVKIDNINTNCACQGNLICATVTTNAFCPGNCSSGPVNYVPKVERTKYCLGWTNNTMTTRQVAANISSYDLSKALYLDTILIRQSARQVDNQNNLYLDFFIGKAGSLNKLTPVDINFVLYRNGSQISSGTLTTFTNTTSGSNQLINWNLTSLLPLGGILKNDSFVTIAKYIVATNQGLPQNDIQSGGRHYHYNLVAGVKTYCIDPVAEMYLVGTTLVDGRNGFYTSGCDVTSIGGSGSNLARRFNTSGELFKNEFRPVMLIDSVVVQIPTGYDVVEISNNFGGGVMTPNSINGNEYTYINPGTWNPLGLTVTNAYGGNIYYKIRPNCNAEATSLHRVKIYIKDYYYALSGRATYPAQYEYVLNNSWSNIAGNNNFREQAIYYNTLNRPDLKIQNLTVIVQATSKSHYWDVEIKNDGLSAAPYAWLALEKLANTSLTIDSIKILPTNQKLTLKNYASGNYWSEISTAGIASGNKVLARIYFSTGKCGDDSILFNSGWNCSGYPSPDPSSNVNTCVNVTSVLHVENIESEIQLSVLRNPGNGSPISLCSTDTVSVLVNSAQSAGVVDPILKIQPPAGISLSPTFGVEYPLNSGNIQNLTSTIVGGIHIINLKNHTLIGNNGLPGTLLNPGTNNRQIKINCYYNTDCGHTSGNPLAFTVIGQRPCGDMAKDNGIVYTNGIDIAGATVTGGIGLTLDLPTTVFKCGSATTLSLTATPVITSTESEDTIIYHLPPGVQYNGNFQTISNCQNCSPILESGPLGSSYVKIHLDSGVNVGNTIAFKFDIATNVGKGCNSLSIQASVKRTIPPLYCGTMQCLKSTAIIGKSSSTPLLLNFPDLIIPTYNGKFITGNPQFVYSYNGTIRNISTTTSIELGTATILETYFDIDKNYELDVNIDSLVHTKIIYDSIGKNNGEVNFADTFTYANGVYADPTRPMLTAIRSENNCICNSVVSPLVMGLPINWNYVDAEQINDQIKIRWSRNSETSNSIYEIERRYSGEANFNKINLTYAQGQNDYEYSFVNNNVDLNQNYVTYRIKYINNKGESEYSEEKQVFFKTNLGQISIFPNPVKNNLIMESNSVLKFNYVIYNLQGSIVAQSNLMQNKFELNMQNLPDGLYFVNLINSQGVKEIRKIIVEK